MLIDTHCHFEPEDDAAALLAEAAAADVRVLAVGGSTALNAAAAASGAPFAYGFDWSDDAPPTPPPESPRLVAIGELGFDFHWKGPETADAQRERFDLQAGFARERDLPIIVHTREADDLTLAALRAADLPRTGVIHSFTGDKALARACLDLGYYISLSGILTFRNADALREVARWLPADRILVETDSPYLAPVPHRGKRNCPAFVAATAACLAELRGLTLPALADLTTANALRLFGPRLLA